MAKARGNGNCLYNSISLCLTGTEDAATRLREAAYKELHENPEEYIHHPHIIQCIKQLKLKGQDVLLLFQEMISDEEILRNMSHEFLDVAIRWEAEKPIKINSGPVYCRLWH